MLGDVRCCFVACRCSDPGIVVWGFRIRGRIRWLASVVDFYV